MIYFMRRFFLLIRLIILANDIFFPKIFCLKILNHVLLKVLLLKYYASFTFIKILIEYLNYFSALYSQLTIYKYYLSLKKIEIN